MSKRAHPQATAQQVLQPVHTHCPSCGRRMWFSDRDERVRITRADIVPLRLQIHRCPHAACPRYHRPDRPAAEGRRALPKHEFGRDVIARIGTLRYQAPQSVPEIHRTLRGRGVAVSERSVTHLLERDDELVALTVADIERRQGVFVAQGRVILALDGMQPEVGQEVLWVLREVLAGEVLLARSLLSATEADLTALLQEVTAALPVPVVGVGSRGQHAIRNAVSCGAAGRGATGSVSSMTCGRRRNRCMRRTATPSRSCSSRCAGCARWSGPWRGGRMRRRACVAGVGCGSAQRPDR